MRPVAGLILCLLLAGCSANVPVPTSNEAFVYVIHRAWHTDIGLPVEEIAPPLATVEQAFPGVRVLTFGFGERQFLLDRRPSIGAMLHALLPSRSAVLMTALTAPPDQAFGAGNVVVLHVTRTGLQIIEAAIWQELEISADGQPLLLAEGPYPGSVFYAARDTYDGFYTCNSWTADVLRAGDLPMPAGVLFSAQIIGSARWIAARQAQSESRLIDAGNGSPSTSVQGHTP